MPDLSAYVDFSVSLDKSGITPEIVLTDTSTYPGGVAATVTGVFSVTQPDGISVVGNWTTPDVTYVGSALTPNSKELRLATDDNFQNGLYVISYTVKATGYTDTPKTKTFVLIYTPVKLGISDLSDVFTPSLQVIDSTRWAVSGFASPTVTRAWTAAITYVGSGIQNITSNAILFDLSYSGSYYDAHYDITFNAIATYVNSTAAWLSLTDVLSSDFQLDEYTPPTLTQLRNSLTALKTSIDDDTYCGGGCGCGSADYTPFNTAQNVFDIFLQNGQNGDNTESLYPDIVKMTKIFNCSGLVYTEHTNAVVPPYNWGIPVPPYIIHTPIQFTVGGGQPYAPADGDTDYINPTLAGFTGYLVFSQSNGDYLTAGTDFTYNNAGGWSWLNGRTFAYSEKYTLIFPQ